MALSYVALLVFAVVAVFIPASMIAFSKLIRMRRASGTVSRLSFESAEQTIGDGTSIMTEYFHYFTGFLAFEVVAAVLILWVYVQGSLSEGVDLYFFGGLALAMLLEYCVIIFATRRGGAHG